MLKLPNTGQPLVQAAFVGRGLQAERSIEQVIAYGRCCVRIVLRDVRNNLSEISYRRVCDFDSEIHRGMSKRTSSIDLNSSG